MRSVSLFTALITWRRSVSQEANQPRPLISPTPFDFKSLFSKLHEPTLQQQGNHPFPCGTLLLLLFFISRSHLNDLRCCVFPFMASQPSNLMQNHAVLFLTEPIKLTSRQNKAVSQTYMWIGATRRAPRLDWQWIWNHPWVPNHQEISVPNYLFVVFFSLGKRQEAIVTRIKFLPGLKVLSLFLVDLH